MLDIEYGVSEQQFESYGCPSTVVKFGDGLTTIQECLWDEYKTVGIGMLRDGNIKPFASVTYSEDNPAPVPETGSVVLMFDNVHSIDAIIKQLEQAKGKLVDMKLKAWNDKVVVV